MLARLYVIKNVAPKQLQYVLVNSRLETALSSAEHQYIYCSTQASTVAVHKRGILYAVRAMVF
jgi:hypothetical protein